VVFNIVCFLVGHGKFQTCIFFRSLIFSGFPSMYSRQSSQHHHNQQENIGTIKRRWRSAEILHTGCQILTFQINIQNSQFR
jgi:hypothetical protein